MAQQSHIAVTLVTPPAQEPISLIEAKAHLRVTITDDDDLIAGLISVARELVEAWTGRVAMAATYRLMMDRFPLLPNSQFSPGNPTLLQPIVNNVWPLDASAWAIYLPRCPLISVTGIQFVGTDNQLQTMDPSGYFVDADSEPPRIAPIAGAFWPSVLWQPSAVRVTFQAGYAAAGNVPNLMKHAIKLLVGHFYQNREATIGMRLDEAPLGVRNLIAALGPQFVW